MILVEPGRTTNSMASTQHPVQGFHIVAAGVFQSADIPDNDFGGDILGIDDAAQGELIHHLLEADSADFCDDLGLGDLFGIQSQHDVLLVQTGEADKGLGIPEPLLLE